MSSFEDLFTSAELDVVVPESGIDLPPGPDADEWLERLDGIDRKQAFFDEHLQTLFTLRIRQLEAIPSPTEPPRILLEFLAHVQVLLEASYISPEPSSTTEYAPSPSPSARFNVPTSPPPRTSSIKKPVNLNLSLSPNPTHHPSILPPATPNPTPASAAVDQRYLQAEGVVLTSKIWGQDIAGTGVLDKKQGDTEDQEGKEGFYLLWSEKHKVWVAVYRAVLDIAFLRLSFANPLLCLTLSATLRDQPLALASSSSPLAAYINTIGGLSVPASPTSPSLPPSTQQESSAEAEGSLGGPPEMNLLAGLYAGPTFAPASSLSPGRPPSSVNGTPAVSPTTAKAKSPSGESTASETSTYDDLKLSTARLGPNSRAKLFALPPIQPETPSTSMITPTPLAGPSALPSSLTTVGSHLRQPTMGRGKAVLRKSFRKILETTSGFKVRMRTVFVPAVLLDDAGEEDLEDVDLDSSSNVGAAEAGQSDDGDEDPDRLTSGASERTVVLCVEIETEGDPMYRFADAPDFVVEKVDVSITGSAGGGEEGASARLIGWDTADAIAGKRSGKSRTNKVAEKTSFPLYLAPHEQHNLLYAVSFLRSPQEEALDGVGSMLNPSSLTTGVGMNSLPSAAVLGPSGGVKPSAPDKTLQRAVTINIFGKPCYDAQKPTTASAAQPTQYHYPTATFSSRWNCVLDLSLSQQNFKRDFGEDYGEHTPHPMNNALPEPPSPFPVPVSSSYFPSRPASSSYPSIASVVSPKDRRSLGLGFGLDLGLGSLGLGSGGSNGRPSSFAFPSASGPATSSMTDKRHTLPTLPRNLPPHIQSAGPTERPTSALGPSRERKDSLGLLGNRQRRDSLPAPSPTVASSSKYLPPSVSASTQQSSMRSPTTYEAPPPPPFKDINYGNGPNSAGQGLSVMIPSVDQAMGLAPPTAGPGIPPMTPAWPAFPTNHSALPPTPQSQGPLIAQGGNLPPNSANPGAGYVGPSVEVRRERGMGGFGYTGMASAVPQTPGPVVGFGTAGAGTKHGGGSYTDAYDARGENMEQLSGGSESIVVSVGLLSQPIFTSKTSFSSIPGTLKSRDSKLIYPLSTFTLDIFVFNRSTWTRRFEVSCPDSRSRRKRREVESYSNRTTVKRRTNRGKGPAPLPDPGVLPLENRVRIGPLLPSACQSVRMKFLAVSPGVHSIDTLTLTDVESGFAMNLRSVMDVVVHEPEGHVV